MKRLITRYCFIGILFLFGTKLVAQPLADFSATPVSGCAPLLVNFQDKSTGKPTSWKWDLGNGTISYLQNPSVTYFSAGQYKIILIASNLKGADTIVKEQYITVYAPPVVNFTGLINSMCVPLPVQFNGQAASSNGAVSSWKWDFGDGSISADQNPQHIYTAPGNHDVTLQVTNSAGCIGSSLQSKFINVPQPVLAGFTNQKQNSCNPPLAIHFKNTSTGSDSMFYKWDFGDGISSSLDSLSHIYTKPGNYTAQLTATNGNGCTNTFKETIVIGSVLTSFTPDTVCPGKQFVFSNTSVPVPQNVYWDFGDNTSSASLNPKKSYSFSGNYTVSMVADYGACLDSISKIVTVLPLPSFVADDSVSCKAPFTVHFTSNLPAGVEEFWDFGDSTTSSAKNPSHTYTKVGVFDVTLTSGCQQQVQRLKYITIQPPVITFPNLPVQACIPFTDTFYSYVNTAVPITQYYWNFGDGATSTLRNPVHTYPVLGTYTVMLTATTADGCTITQKADKGVAVGNIPVAAFTASQRVACAGSPIMFTDLSTGNPNQWLWFFGDGVTSTLQNPVHSYNSDTGYFQVSLVVRNSGCPNAITYTKYIYIKPPIGKFSVGNDCAHPKLKTFIDRSIGADTWSWDFGDSTYSSLRSPVHTYADTGTYKVGLTVANIASGCTYTTSGVVKLVILKAAFTTADTVLCNNSTATFQVSNSVNPAQVLNYTWDFGDGGKTILLGSLAPQSLQFKHTYTTPGVYNVRLILTDILGCNDTLVKPAYVKVDSITANFASTVFGACLNSTIHFIDSSLADYQHPIVQWAWDYGDGSTGTSGDMFLSHLYIQPGSYKLKLKITDSNGCSDSLIKSDYIIISKPVANFATIDTASCPLQGIPFANLSNGNGLTYLWNFGDSISSAASAPVHSYFSTGNFNVSLKVTDKFGCMDSIAKINYVAISYPVADFSMSDSISSCPPFFITFNNLSSNYVSLHWDFGDGNTSSLAAPIHSYYTPGIYTVTLTATSPGGCTNIKQRKIVLKGPQGTLTYQPLSSCKTLLANFTAKTINNSSFIWDFNDGNTLATTDSVVSHKYIDTGKYLPKMILIDANGCHVAVTGIDTIKVIGVSAAMKTINTVICDSGYASFADSSNTNGVISGYLWSFGDGTTSTASNPIHRYKTAALYYPQLKVTTQNGCSDSVVAQIPVSVIASPRINFVTSGNGCTPLTVSFAGALVAANPSPLNWKWDFGNSDSALVKNPSQEIYTVAGIYKVQLSATDNNGCKSTVSNNIEAYSIPVVSAGADTTVCLGKLMPLKASGADTYEWSPLNNLSCIDCAGPLTSTTQDIVYSVLGTTGHGCSATASVHLKVARPFSMQVSASDSLCQGSSAKVSANGANSYAWTPKESLNNAAIANPKATPGATTTYKVIGSDASGCFKDTGYVVVKVFPIPTVNAGLDTTINVGQTATLTPLVSNDVTKVIWSPSGDIFRGDAYSSITVKPNQTTNYQVQVMNAGGCEASDEVTVYVICNGSNVFIPNTFSPNGDGVNDIFYPRGTGLFAIKMFRVYNRTGQMVYEKTNFNANDAAAGWDGTLQGVKAATDVYIYIMDIECDNNNVLTYKGNIALIR